MGLRAIEWVWLVLAIGCTASEDDDDDEGSEPMLSGSISLLDRDATATVGIRRAFGFDQGGKLISYLANNGQVTCADTVEYLQSHSEPFDPSDFLVGGTCDIYFSHTDWTGDLTASDDPFEVAGMTVNCALGDGEFVL